MESRTGVFAPVGFTEILSLEWDSNFPVQFDNIVLVPREASADPGPSPGPAPIPGAGDATLEIRWASLDLKDRGGKHAPDHRFSVDDAFTFKDKTLKIEFHTKGRLKIKGKKLDLSAVDPEAPIIVGFRVGNDSGSATITLDRRGKFKR